MRKIWNKRLADDVEQSVISDYKSGLSSIKLAQKYGFKRPKSILDILSKYNISRRSTARITEYNRDFFLNICTEVEAYALGLFLTDGYVLSSGNAISIQLQERDAGILYDLAEHIGKSCKFLCIKPKSIRHQPMIRMTIHCKQIVQQAKAYGLVHRKTHTLKLRKKIRPDLIPAFCRGIFDGDGTTGKSKNGNIWCQFVTASKCFAEQFVKLEIPADLKIYKPSKGRKTYTVRICGGNANTIKFLHWLYHDSNFYIKRKNKILGDI